MARPAARRHRHDVEAEGEVGEAGAAGEEMIERALDAAALARRHRLDRLGERGPRLHLDRRHHRAAPGDDVDLAHRHAVVAGEDAVAAKAEAEDAEPLAEAAAAPGAAPFGRGAHSSSRRATSSSARA